MKSSDRRERKGATLFFGGCCGEMTMTRVEGNREARGANSKKPYETDMKSTKGEI